MSDSGNGMGDAGARLLAKALQINSRLRTIYYDKNNITLQGYCDLAYALERLVSFNYLSFIVVRQVYLVRLEFYFSVIILCDTCLFLFMTSYLV